MKRTLILSGITFLLVVVSLVYFGWIRPSQAEQTAENLAPKIENAKSNAVSAPGVVEAVSEEIEVGAEIGGKLKSVLVEEGETVAKGQIVAVLENDDFAVQIQIAKAEIQTLFSQKETANARLQQAETDKTRIVNGARREERREAAAGFEGTNAVLENARREVERRRKLYDAGDISREEFERANRDLQIAEAKSKETKERFNTINAAARPDDLAKADAAIALAKSQFREFDALIAAARTKVIEAEARLAKTVVRSPVAGVVLRKRLNAGESFSPENSASGIVTVGDVSALRVRVDVDEADVAKISENQRTFVTADAFGEQKFYGRIVRVGQILGRKNIRTDEPTERVDKKILEVLIQLDANQKLPLGLRVDAFIETEHKGGEKF